MCKLQLSGTACHLRLRIRYRCRCEKMLAAGAKRALKLKVGGAFHSPLMEPARAELAAAIEATPIHKPSCPVYQNVSTERRNLIRENNQG